MTIVLANANPTVAEPVDLELVLAVDVSRSMDADEQALQRAGYIAAFRDPDVLQAVRQGPLARIAVTYVEWAGAGLQQVVLPWTMIHDRASTERVARALEATPFERMRRTSISDALLFSAQLFGTGGFEGRRRIIDVSGDGPNNAGYPVLPARDQVLAQGITVNGLPIMLKRGYTGFFDVKNLDLYYEDCVIGGLGAFLVTVQHPDEFARAIRRKLILEIAGRVPPSRTVPARIIPAQINPAQVTPAQVTGPSESTDCLIGEKLWDAWMHGAE
ncbi:MAG: DUF1194 domain-containing protein [Alphaproteobacteria bacterium]|nr:DUF1194 domain-containing protein [Alphaproteobacteria bacterium]